MSAAIVLIFLVPCAGGAVAFLLGPRRQWIWGLAISAATVASVGMLAAEVLEHGVRAHRVGGWFPPLGIQLRCDGLSLLLILLTSATHLVTSVYAAVYLGSERRQESGGGLFWPLWLFLWGGLNCLFVSGDLFNVYLLLEFVLLASVALAALSGSRAAMISAFRYLIAGTVAALFYLIGVALLYSEYSTLDMEGLRQAAPAGYLPVLALAFMSGGLALKSALFPLHFWLPAAHSTAPAPVSAVLSALVVKAGAYVLMRLWFEISPPTAPAAGPQLLAALGAAAVLWGSVQALRQDRLKMLVAYSTVAQVGYLFLLFPLAADHPDDAVKATTYQILSHGLAKAGMFLGAGALVKAAASDLLERTAGAIRNDPLAVLAILISGAALAGIAPGGGAKGKMLEVAWAHGHWAWAVVIVLGMPLAAAYTALAVRHSFRTGHNRPAEKPPGVLGLLALTLALASLGVSLFSDRLLAILKITFEP
jgi:multicomponent Na+:H+ antiporter subunit D